MTADLAAFTPRALPGRAPLDGRHVRVEPITDGARFGELFDAFNAPGGEHLWDYLAYGPFPDRAAFAAFAARTYTGADPLFHAIVPRESGRAAGVASLMRIDAANGVVEVGHICLAPVLQRTRAASEAFLLLFSRVFDELGYRRLEWKCNDRNEASKRAAARYGFTFEGVFRQHMVVKGQNRDTAWFSITDKEWPEVSAAFRGWLADDNFDADGAQRRSLVKTRDELPG